MTHSRQESIFWHWQTAALLGGFIGLRILSYLLVGHPIIQGVFVFGLIMLLAALYFKDTHAAWYVVLTELLLGGSGHFFELGSLSVRTLFLYTFLFLWFVHTASTSKLWHRFHIPHRVFYALAPITLIAAFAFFHGIWLGNPTRQALQDFIPYTLFFLVLPAYHLFHGQRPFASTWLARLFVVFFIGSALFALYNAAIFSTGMEVLHEPYYNWFRDVAHGKITAMGNGFFRIVLPEHLLLPGGFLVLVSLLSRDEKHHPLWRVLLAAIALTLAINFSRSYWIAIAIALPFLAYKHKKHLWLKETVFACTLLIGSFLFINILSSGGQSLGLPLISNRFGAIQDPTTEVSSYTRMSLLTPIGEKIAAHPIVGNGLGSSITFFSPTKKAPVTTNQFDWGYLEIFAELGIIGLASILGFLIFLIIEILHHIRSVHDYQDLHIGLLGAVIALMVMTVFTPAVFHVFGVLFLVMVTAIATKPVLFLDRIVHLIYRVFHRKMPPLT